MERNTDIHITLLSHIHSSMVHTSVFHSECWASETDSGFGRWTQYLAKRKIRAYICRRRSAKHDESRRIPASVSRRHSSSLPLIVSQGKDSPYLTMAENVPPPDNTRGVPYYEKLKRDLRDTLQKKRLLDKNMVPAVPQDPQQACPLILFPPRPPLKIRSSATSRPTSKKRVPAT